MHIEKVLGINGINITISNENGPKWITKERRIFPINFLDIDYVSDNRHSAGIHIGDKVKVKEPSVFGYPSLLFLD